MKSPMQELLYQLRKERTDSKIKHYPKQEKQKDLKEKLFNLANEFAIAKKGDIAVLLHSIHNKLP